MIKNKIKISGIYGVLYFVICVFAVCVMSLSVYAEGSRNLIDSAGGQGDRAYIEFQGDDMLSVGLKRQQYIDVYMYAGETAYFGGSVAKTGAIEVTDPKGDTVNYDVETNGVGYIDSLTKETAGPNFDGTNADGYNPLSFIAERNGIYTFRFYSKGYTPENKTLTTNPTPISVVSDGFVANQNDAAVGAWDVTVVGKSSGGESEIKNGRMFVDYLSLNIGANGKRLYSEIYVLTSDGYIYNTNFNGIDPYGFTFFGNNRGLVSTRTNSSLYHSMKDSIVSGNTPNLNNFTGITDTSGAKDGMYLPGPGNASTQLDSSFKIFFSYPNEDLPKSVKPDPLPPGTIDYLKFEGSVIDSNGSVIENQGYVGGGGYFIINAHAVANFEVKINLSNVYYKLGASNEIDESTLVSAVQEQGKTVYYKMDGNKVEIANIDEYINAGTVVIGNSCVEGINRIFWNGCDENGRILPKGIYFNNGFGSAVAIPKAGEYHFPLIDVEELPEGIKITRLNSPDTLEQKAFADERRSYVYYNNLEKSVLRSGSYKGVDRQTIWSVADKLDMRSGVDTSVNGACVVTNKGADKTVLDFWTDLRLPDDSGTKSSSVELITKDADVKSILLAGFAFYDSNRDRKYDMIDNDYALSGVKVQLFDNMGALISETETDSRGFYKFVAEDSSKEYTIKVLTPNDTYFTTTNNQEQTFIPDNIVVGQTASAEDVGFFSAKAAPVRINKTWAVPTEEQPDIDVEFMIEGRDKNGDISSPVLYSRTVTLKSSDGYSALVDDLPEIIYINSAEVYLAFTVEETTVTPGFTSSITSEQEGTVWNCLNKPDDLNISVEKTWTVASEFAKPDNITVNLMRKNQDGTYEQVKGVQEKALNEQNGWNTSFSGIPKYEEYVENGVTKYRAIEYSVSENNKPLGFAASIQKSKDISKTNTFVITNSAEGSVKLVKIDKDTSSVLPGAKYKLYQIDESKARTEINHLKPVYDSSNQVEKYKYDEKSSIMELETNKNGEIIVEDLYDGKYCFVETEAPAGYVTPNGKNAESALLMIDMTNDDVDSRVSAPQVTMINSLESTATPEPTATATPEPTAPATPEPTATATPEPTAPATPEPTATATPEPTAPATPEPTATATPEPTATATPEPTAPATPEPTATATPEPIATEIPEPMSSATPEPTATATPEPTESATPEPTATIVPTTQPGDFVKLNVSKSWEDVSGNITAMPPAELSGYQVDIALVINGVVTDNIITLDENSGYSSAFDNLDKYDENGNLVNYSIEELNPPFGYFADYTSIGDNYKITNIQPCIIGRVFYDAENSGSFDDSVDSGIENAQIILTDKSGEQISEPTRTDKDGYYFFYRIPVNDDGSDTEYSVRVLSPLEDVDCTTTETGNQTANDTGGVLNITQNLVISKENHISNATDTGLYGNDPNLNEQNVNVIVQKVWSDNNDRLNKRPESIEIEYFLKNFDGDSVVTKNLTLSEQNDWQEEFIMPYRAVNDFEVIEVKIDGYKEPKITSGIDKDSGKFIITVNNSIITNSSSSGGGRPTGADTNTSTAPPKPQTSATPIPSGPELDKLNHYAYIIGYPEGDVRPQNNISRDEVATIFFRMLTDTSRNEFWMTINPYTDVPTDMWSNNAISTMSNARILNGDPDGTFRPIDNITRGEFAAIAARFSSKEYNGENKFSDTSGHWSEEYINRAAQEGWISGYPDGSFKPDQYITRAEAMTLVNNILNRHAKEDGMLGNMLKWPDNVQEEWYYTAVQEATNSHYYNRDDDGFNETWTEIREPRDWVQLEKTWSDANSAGSEDSVYDGE